MKTKNLLVLLLAFCIVVLAIGNIFVWTRNAENEILVAELQKELEKLKDDYLTLDANLISLNDLNVHMSKELEMFRNRDNKIFILTSENPVFEESKAIISWNKKDFSLFVSAENLIKLSDQKVFILWAKQEGKYNLAAVLPRTINGNFQSISTEIKQVDDFFITIEKSSDVKAPSLNETYLSGNQ